MAIRFAQPWVALIAVTATAFAQDYTVVEKDDEIQIASKAKLEPNHSHFLLVPGTEWSDECKWISAIASTIAEDAEPRSGKNRSLELSGSGLAFAPATPGPIQNQQPTSRAAFANDRVSKPTRFRCRFSRA